MQLESTCYLPNGADFPAEDLVSSSREGTRPVFAKPGPSAAAPFESRR
jgi:hypothetical protein